MSRLTVAGIGPGEADYILPAVIKKMKKAEWNGQILYLLRETRYNITSMFVKGYELGIR